MMFFCLIVSVILIGVRARAGETPQDQLLRVETMILDTNVHPRLRQRLVMRWNDLSLQCEVNLDPSEVRKVISIPAPSKDLHNLLRALRYFDMYPSTPSAMAFRGYAFRKVHEEITAEGRGLSEPQARQIAEILYLASKDLNPSGKDSAAHPFESMARLLENGHTRASEFQRLSFFSAMLAGVGVRTMLKEDFMPELVRRWLRMRKGILGIRLTDFDNEALQKLTSAAHNSKAIDEAMHGR